MPAVRELYNLLPQLSRSRVASPLIQKAFRKDENTQVFSPEFYLTGFPTASLMRRLRDEVTKFIRQIARTEQSVGVSLWWILDANTPAMCPYVRVHFENGKWALVLLHHELYDRLGEPSLMEGAGGQLHRVAQPALMPPTVYIGAPPPNYSAFDKLVSKHAAPSKFDPSNTDASWFIRSELRDDLPWLFRLHVPNQHAGWTLAAPNWIKFVPFELFQRKHRRIFIPLAARLMIDTEFRQKFEFGAWAARNEQDKIDFTFEMIKETVSSNVSLPKLRLPLPR